MKNSSRTFGSGETAWCFLRWYSATGVRCPSSGFAFRQVDSSVGSSFRSAWYMTASTPSGRSVPSSKARSASCKAVP